MDNTKQNTFSYNSIDKPIIIEALDSFIEDCPFEEFNLSESQIEININSAKSVRKKILNNVRNISAEDIRLIVMSLEYLIILMDDYNESAQTQTIKEQIIENSTRKSINKMLSSLYPLIDELLEAKK